MKLRRFMAGVIGAGAFWAANAAPAADLLPHHAVYDISLDHSPNGSVIAANGKMDYQISDACDAWATSQRLDMVVNYQDGTSAHMISDYVTWEQKDGSLLRFRLRQLNNGKVVSEVEGEADRKPDGSGEIDYSIPEGKVMPLPKGTMFPLAQTVALINAALKGQKFLATPLFDGTEDDGAEDSFTVMGRFAALPMPRFAPLQKVASGKVSISFFDRDQKETQPNYEVGMRYWQNGVSDELAMDFGDFVVKGELSGLTPNGKRC
jgi:hypothetical protein